MQVKISKDSKKDEVKITIYHNGDTYIITGGAINGIEVHKTSIDECIIVGMVKRQVFLRKSTDSVLISIAKEDGVGVSTVIRNMVEKSLFLLEQSVSQKVNNNKKGGSDAYQNTIKKPSESHYRI